MTIESLVCTACDEEACNCNAPKRHKQDSAMTLREALNIAAEIADQRAAYHAELGNAAVSSECIYLAARIREIVLVGNQRLVK